MNTLAVLALALPTGFLLGRSTPESTPAPGPELNGPAATMVEAPPAGTYKIDGGHSSVVFNVTHLDASRFWGRFNSVSGQFVVDPAKPENSSILAVVAAESVDTNSEGRDQHLRNPDFFNAKEFPEIIFESTAVSASGEGLKVAGELTLLGKTQAIEVEAEYIGTSENPRFGRRAGYEVSFTFDRTDFGMEYMAGSGLGNEVTVVVSLEGALEQ